VLAVDGATGALRWQALGERGMAFGLAVAPDGDPVAAGISRFGAPDYLVRRLDAATGSERWGARIATETTSRLDTGSAVIVDRDGHVVAGGVLGNLEHEDGVVVSFDGATGAERWRVAHPTAAGAFSRSPALALDGTGDVIAATTGPDPTLFAVTEVSKIDATDGAVRWHTSLDLEYYA
jgi:outer membrane protein assembly factor BamB